MALFQLLFSCREGGVPQGRLRGTLEFPCTGGASPAQDRVPASVCSSWRSCEDACPLCWGPPAGPRLWRACALCPWRLSDAGETETGGEKLKLSQDEAQPGAPRGDSATLCFLDFLPSSSEWCLFSLRRWLVSSSSSSISRS